MITVVCNETGDEAEADTERHALVAARTLLEDAKRAWQMQGFKPTVTFSVDGQPVNGLIGVAAPAIWHALGNA